MLLVSVFLQYTLISGIDNFHNLPSSIRVAFLGHTNLGILQSLQILLVFGCSFHCTENTLHSEVVLVVRYLVLLGVVSTVESSSGQKGKGV